MKLISLKINKRGVTGWQSPDIKFGNHITQVTGENGSGKTPLIQAIVFCLGYPIIFRDDVNNQCESVTLVIQALEKVYRVERFINTDFKVTVKEGENLFSFDNEREYSEFVFSLIGLSGVNLLDTSNKKTTPYMATALPVFFLDQDSGYSEIYKPPATFIKDQFQEMIRYLFRFSQKHLFESAKDLLDLKSQRETQDAIIASHRSVIERLIVKKTNTLSDQEIEKRIADHQSQLDKLSASNGARSDAVAAYDTQIYEVGQSLAEIDRESSELKLRANSFGRINQEIQTEINTLSLNEQARRLFASVDSVCSNSECGLFKKSINTYSKNLWYLKDQVKDLEAASNAARDRAEIVLESRGILQNRLDKLKDQRDQVIKQEGFSSVVGVIRELTESIISLEQDLALSKQIYNVSHRLNDAETIRLDLNEKIDGITNQGRRADQNMVELRVELTTLTLKWLDILGTENVNRSLHIDRELKYQFGEEQIRAFKGSTLVRVILAIHAAIFEAYVSRTGEKFSCLIFDTPNQQEIRTEDLKNFMHELKELCKEKKAQVIFASKDYRHEADIDDILIEPEYPGEKHLMYLGS